MISYKSNSYSVPPEYIGKYLQLQVYDNQLHLYYNMEPVTVHIITQKKMNYHVNHYEQILSRTLPHDNDKIAMIAKENLMKIKDLIDLDEIDSIIIPGDIVNDVNDLEDKEFRSRLQEELLSITKYKPTFVSLGNHDQMTHAKNGEWIPGQTQLLKEAIKEIPNFRFIENGESCDMNYLNISACSPDFNYYEDKDKKKSERESTKDYQRIFKQTYNEKLFSDSTYNIFLTHEPQSINEYSPQQATGYLPKAMLFLLLKFQI